MSRHYQPQLSMQNFQAMNASKLGHFHPVEDKAEGNPYGAVKQQSKSKSRQCFHGQAKVSLS